MNSLRSRTRRWRIGVAAVWFLTWAPLAGAAELEFQITFDAKVAPQPFTGRVYVMLTSAEGREPRFGPDWFRPEPFFAQEVKDWKPGEPVTVGNHALGFPHPLKDLKPGAYSLQAVMDLNLGFRDFSHAPGNGYSGVIRHELDAENSGPITLHIDQTVAPETFLESDRVKLVEIESKLLSQFHGRSRHLRAGVIVPESFRQDDARQYPVIYEIPGFGGRHDVAARMVARNPTLVDGVEMLYVVLDPDCPLGHHVFADSDNNGPVGKALLEELIPAVEQRFRAIARPEARFLTGHSSGGWSSLWLQVTYADFFGGVWSTAPDPVDFRDFQRIDLYKPGTNMFSDEQGQPRPIARIGDLPVLFFRPFSDMERVMGHGGQLESFEAVFSPRGPDGRPRRLWNRDSGEIDRAVAETWKRYDIRLILEQNWSTLGPKLRGKLHVFMGTKDTFYLEGATALLKQSLQSLAPDAVVELIPDKDHRTLLDPPLRARIGKEMGESFRKSQGSP